MSGNVITLKALVDRTNNRVIFAESAEDFIDVLFSFLTMPMGSIIWLTRNLSKVGIGCMENLYKSIENFHEQQFLDYSKGMLVCPRNCVRAHCKKLKLDIVNNDWNGCYSCNSTDCTQYVWSPYENAICSCGEFMGRHSYPNGYHYTRYSGVFVKGMARLIVTDELHIMPASTNASLSLLSKAGVTDASIIEECNFDIRLDEVLKLLMYSLTSKMPLTATFLGKNSDELHTKDLDQVSYVKSKIEELASNANGKVQIKLIISKSKNMVCYAEASEDFVDLLLSFVTVPLGYIVKEMHSGISKGCINHLYNSIHELDVEQFLKSDEHKTMLLSPKCATEFSYENNAFGIDSFSHSNESLPTVVDPLSSTEKATRRRRRFMKGSALFTVTDALIIMPISPISGLSVLKNLKVAFDDIKECTVNVGREEALRLMVASFVSKTALTSTFLEELNPDA